MNFHSPVEVPFDLMAIEAHCINHIQSNPKSRHRYYSHNKLSLSLHLYFPLLSGAGLFNFDHETTCMTSDSLNYFFLALALPAGAEFEGCAGAENIAVFG